MNINRNEFGGLLSFAAFVASAVFFGIEVFSGSLGSVPLTAAGLFSLSLGFVLGRLGL